MLSYDFLNCALEPSDIFSNFLLVDLSVLKRIRLHFITHKCQIVYTCFYLILHMPSNTIQHPAILLKSPIFHYTFSETQLDSDQNFVLIPNNRKKAPIKKTPPLKAFSPQGWERLKSIFDVRLNPFFLQPSMPFSLNYATASSPYKK